MLPKIIVILGPTATGKSDLAVLLAKKFKGEIISADSRQVYKGLNIGSGKITKKEMRGIPHHLLDVVSPTTIFSVATFQKKAQKVIRDIIKRKKIPILCGGTGFYIQSIVEGIVLPEVKPNKDLRKQLEAKSVRELFIILMNLDRNRAITIDPNNPTRLIRAIEIATALGRVPTMIAKPLYTSLQIGLDFPDTKLKRRIQLRIQKRLKQGMIKEVEQLHKRGLSWKRLYDLGIEYRFIAEYLQNKLTKENMLEKLQNEIWHFAKRQRTWFRRDANVKWFQPQQIKKIEKEVEKFLK
jgi:tRNA dimethylallyltransferase